MSSQTLTNTASQPKELKNSSGPAPTQILNPMEQVEQGVEFNEKKLEWEETNGIEKPNKTVTSSFSSGSISFQEVKVSTPTPNVSVEPGSNSFVGNVTSTAAESALSYAGGALGETTSLLKTFIGGAGEIFNYVASPNVELYPNSNTSSTANEKNTNITMQQIEDQDRARQEATRIKELSDTLAAAAQRISVQNVEEVMAELSRTGVSAIDAASVVAAGSTTITENNVQQQITAFVKSGRLGTNQVIFTERQIKMANENSEKEQKSFDVAQAATNAASSEVVVNMNGAMEGSLAGGKTHTSAIAGAG